MSPVSFSVEIPRDPRLLFFPFFFFFIYPVSQQGYNLDHGTGTTTTR